MRFRIALRRSVTSLRSPFRQTVRLRDVPVPGSSAGGASMTAGGEGDEIRLMLSEVAESGAVRFRRFVLCPRVLGGHIVAGPNYLERWGAALGLVADRMQRKAQGRIEDARGRMIDGVALGSSRREPAPCSGVTTTSIVPEQQRPSASIVHVVASPTKGQPMAGRPRCIADQEATPSDQFTSLGIFGNASRLSRPRLLHSRPHLRSQRSMRPSRSGALEYNDAQALLPGWVSFRTRRTKEVACAQQRHRIPIAQRRRRSC